MTKMPGSLLGLGLALAAGYPPYLLGGGGARLGGKRESVSLGKATPEKKKRRKAQQAARKANRGKK